MENYTALARAYDTLMEGVDYKAWSKRINELLLLEGSLRDPSTMHLLEFACGTGNISFLLEDYGYRITGVDRSEDMLMIAEEKRKEDHEKIRFLCHDMVKFQSKEIYDHILCSCDGINYLIEDEEIMLFFRRVYDMLPEKGLFIFDISSQYKLQNVIGDHTFGEDLDEITYLWENVYCKEKEIVEMELTLFYKTQEGTYCKEKEWHRQKAHDHEKLKNKLIEVGFKEIKLYDDLTEEPPIETTERVFFVCRKFAER